MDYEIRKMFEASLADLCTQYGKDRATVRLEVKAELIAAGLIKSSTSELSEGQMEAFAKEFIQVTSFNDRNPPEWKIPFDMQKILFPKTNSND
jgi:hypothetical protein